jgi:hypothetical protein
MDQVCLGVLKHIPIFDWIDEEILTIPAAGLRVSDTKHK